MKISVLTLFPDMFRGPFDHSIIKRAVEDKKLEIEYIDIREFGIGKHRVVDDKPYGGGKGMILKVDVLKKALDETISKNKSLKSKKVILLGAKGSTYNQEGAMSFSKLDHLILICGHYEGVDERITKYIDEEISIGNYVLTGGEVAAISIIDSVARLVPGVLDEEATKNESFTEKDVLEHPQYTRPDVFDGVEVPLILREGNHEKIGEWKKNNKKLKKD